MTKARKTIINVSDTPYYHCMGRCVRRAFLFGEDSFSGKDYSHRKQWIVDKLAELSNIYLIDVCAYAVMSNHYHLVLKINHERAQLISDNEVIKRWTCLFNGNVLISRYLKGEYKTTAEKDKAGEIISLWRERLSDISWFMRCLNETIAHKANKEDNCTGRFWEGRFKSQALLNEQALLSCMAYVDLNPIRAGLSSSLDASQFTSVEQRIKQFSVTQKQPKISDNKKPIKLSDFIGSQQVEGIPYLYKDYLELVDWTGRAIRDDKKGYIMDSEPKIIDKLGFTRDIWLQSVRQFSEHSYSHIGTEEQLNAVCKESNLKWLVGIKQSRQLAPIHLNS